MIAKVLKCTMLIMAAIVLTGILIAIDNETLSILSMLLPMGAFQYFAVKFFVMSLAGYAIGYIILWLSYWKELGLWMIGIISFSYYAFGVNHWIESNDNSSLPGTIFMQLYSHPVVTTWSAIALGLYVASRFHTSSKAGSSVEV